MSEQHTGNDQGRVDSGGLDQRVAADLERTCRSLCRLAVPTLADLAVVYTVDGQSLVRSGSASPNATVSTVADSSFGGLVVDLRTDHPLARIVNERRPMLMEAINAETIKSFFDDGQVPASYGRLGLRSILALPLVAHDRTLGLLGLALLSDERSFGPDEQARAEDLARAAAVVLENGVLARELASSVALLDSVLQTVPVGLAFFDRQLRFLRVNDTLAEIDGIPAAEHVGRTIDELLSGHLPDAVAEEITKVFETGGALLESEVEGTTPAAPGELRHWLTSYFPVRSTDGARIVAAGMVVVEITDRKRAEAERLVLLESAEAAHLELQQAQSRLVLLAEASRRLAGLDGRRILGNLVNMVVPMVSDWAAVDVIDDVGTSHRVASAQSDPDRAVGEGASVRVPIEVRGRAIGTLHVAEPRLGGGLPELDLRLAEDLAGRAAVAVDTARLFEREHQLAVTLQHSLLPGSLPQVARLERAYRYVPGTIHQEVGGDWYDMVRGPDGRVAFTIGDVVGHDINAASVMGQLRNAVRVYASDGHEPAAVALRLNRLVDALGMDQMATLVHLVIEPFTGTAVYTNAGHLTPLLIHPDGRSEWLDGGNSLPIGAVPEPEWAEAAVALAPGDTVLLFTDGLIEERTMAIDVGLDRLRQAAESAAALDVEGLCDQVVVRLMAGEPRGDDVALLAVRWAP